MKVELLGTMRVLIAGQPMPKVRSRKAKWLLALLVLRGGKPIARTALAGTLWPDTDAETALTNLRSVASDLRRALGDQAHRLQMPDRRSLGFDIENVEIDVREFDAAIERRDFEAAVALYQGPFLQDCEEDWARPERSLREQACLGAYHELVGQADLARARDLAQRAVEIAPGQDAPRRDLMAAYARGGDLNAALAVYRDFAQALRAETGGVPDPQTTDLYIRLRSGRPPAEPMGSAIRPSLPYAISSFVGREDERADLIQAIRSHRLVTLTGVGGVGKTRLAREVATDLRMEFRDEAGFVPFEAAQSEGALIQMVVASLRIKLNPRVTPLQSLLDALRAKRLLLVFDNCEHLLSACAGLAERILSECPEVRILATSREPLGLVGERVWPLAGLSTPNPDYLPAHSITLLKVLMGYESVRLFVERAQSVAKEFTLSPGNAAAVAEFCAILEGSPLAIELAAGRVRTLAVAEILARFRAHRLDFLAGNRHASVSRHQTLRAALDWSYSLLGPEERRLFARFAIFADGWTVEAAEAVTGATASRLESLVEKSLIMFSAEGRYTFLETVREYATECLLASGEGALLGTRHVAYYTQLAQDLAANQAPHEAYEREMGNFRAVMDREESDPAKVLDLTRSLHWYWLGTYAMREGTRRVEDALAKVAADASPARAQAFRNLALYQAHSNRTEALELHQESLRIWRALGDHAGIARALSSLGLDAYFIGEMGRAKLLLEECVALARENIETPGFAGILAYGLNALALRATQTAEYPEAQAFGEESLATMRRGARPVDAATVLRTLAGIAREVQDFATARRLNDEALDIYRMNGHDDGAAWCLNDLGGLATELGEAAFGEDLIEEALATMRRLGDSFGTATAIELRGHNAVARGDFERGRRMFAESRSAYESLEHRVGVARALDGLGDAARFVGDPHALAHYREGLAIWCAVGAQKRIRDGLLHIGHGLGGGDRSIRLWAFAHRLGETIGAPLPLRIREPHQRAIRAAQADPGFKASWAAGDGMSLEAALDLAKVSLRGQNAPKSVA